ncbi:MAG: hypothetical protein JO306_04265 [Gemmatimonadetes bacterium]|nr:hypothetical protein [Gemmatimonadota bacterium]
MKKAGFDVLEPGQDNPVCKSRLLALPALFDLPPNRTEAWRPRFEESLMIVRRLSMITCDREWRKNLRKCVSLFQLPFRHFSYLAR